MPLEERPPLVQGLNGTIGLIAALLYGSEMRALEAPAPSRDRFSAAA